MRRRGGGGRVGVGFCVGVLVGHREKDLESGGEALRLQLAPHAALVAHDAVHYARYVPEVLAELRAQVCRLAAEHGALGEPAAELPAHRPVSPSYA